MQNVLPVVCFLFGLAAGALLAWAWLHPAARQAYDRAKAEFEPERAVLTERLQNREERYRELEAALNDARQKLSDTFKALSADALDRNNHAFLELAAGTLQPVRESLDKVDGKIQALEAARAGAYASLSEQVRSLAESQTQLRAETGKLVTALRTPGVRGRWGEMQLQRVVEMAGMLEHCDFYSQPIAITEEGRLRPDLLVRLPGGKNIVVDAKAPLEACLAASEAADDETRHARLLDHARQVRAHITALGRKSYWEQFDPAPEFVVLFLPGESFFSAALENDPALLEAGGGRVILATPTTLIALLRAVAYGWRQENIAQNAAEISRLGKELYKRLGDLSSHWSRLGKSLERAVEAYNSACGSLDARVLVTARKFEELKTSAFGVVIEPAEPVDTRPRALQSPEMIEGDTTAGTL